MSTLIRNQITFATGRTRSIVRRCSLLLAMLIYALLNLGVPQMIHAQCGTPPEAPCKDAACQVDELLLNTGFDHSNGGVYPVGNPDGFWTIVQDDNPARPVPRPANVIAPAPGWGGPLGNSQWIGPEPTANDNFIGEVTYEKCFCVCTDVSDITFNLDVLADDEAKILVDGTTIGGTPNPGYPNLTNFFFTLPLTRGRHCIEVVVKNTAQKYSGVDIKGTVNGSGLMSYNCCPQPVLEDLDECQTTKLSLVTDDSWTMVSGPLADPLNYPRCATIITNPHPAWAAPVAGTNWIGRDINGSSQPGQPGPPPQSGCIPFSGLEHYLYRKSFCVDRDGPFVITVTSLADDFGANIILNGISLGVTGSYASSTTQTFIVYLYRGCNCFEFDVEDKGCAVTGLSALIDIQGGILLREQCCDCGQCDVNPMQRENHNGNDGLSAAPDNRSGSMAPRPTLLSIPNPSTGEVTVHYVLDKESEATVELFNAAGQRVMTVDQGKRNVGVHAVPVVTKGLPAGAYHLQLKYGEKTLSIPMNVQ